MNDSNSLCSSHLLEFGGGDKEDDDNERESASRDELEVSKIVKLIPDCRFYCLFLG